MDTTNLEKNVLKLVEEHPETQFYLFWTPYSIIYYDNIKQGGDLKNILRMEREAIELMLSYKNIHFYSFNDEFDIITNLDNYKDILHYSGDVNSYMLSCMKEEIHMITEDNYDEYCERIWNFYTTYDYDSIWK